MQGSFHPKDLFYCIFVPSRRVQKVSSQHDASASFYCIWFYNQHQKQIHSKYARFLLSTGSIIGWWHLVTHLLSSTVLTNHGSRHRNFYRIVTGLTWGKAAENAPKNVTWHVSCLSQMYSNVLRHAPNWVTYGYSQAMCLVKVLCWQCGKEKGTVKNSPRRQSETRKHVG